MEIASANIKISRHGDVLNSITLSMPIWSKVESDESIELNIPLFGIKTFAKDEEDIDSAVEEALKSFCIVAEKFGRGLETELGALGWEFVEEENENSLLDYNPHDAVLEQMMGTGEEYSNNLVLA